MQTDILFFIVIIHVMVIFELSHVFFFFSVDLMAIFDNMVMSLYDSQWPH